MPYRKLSVVLPDQRVIYLTEQAHLASMLAQRHARSATRWAYFAVGVNVVNIIVQVIIIGLRHGWF